MSRIYIDGAQCTNTEDLKKGNYMTLDEFITQLTNLRDRHNAGDFVMMTDYLEVDGSEIILDGITKMDGDNFYLDLEDHTVNISAKFN